MENKYKCQVNWSENTGFLLNTYADDPQEAATLFKQLKEEVGLADIPEKQSEAVPVPETNSSVCPQCGSPMVKRTKKSDGSSFWGCSNFPACKGVRNI